jgi:hypothetical protein
MKKPEFLLPFARLFTRIDSDAYDTIPFQSADTAGDEEFPALASPTTWAPEAVALMAEGAACTDIPSETRPVEENTVPSWLWRHRAAGNYRAAEGDLRMIIDRAVGSAAAKAWQLGLFTSEKHARAFFDETRYGLMQRHIAITPEVIAPWGLSWAYGNEQQSTVTAPSDTETTALLSNAAIDNLLHETKDAAADVWKKLLSAPATELSHVTLRLSDIAADWHSSAPNRARAAIDLMALRHNDGSINIDALRQAARLLTIMLDLQDRGDVTISLVNLAPLLLALGLAYDSDAARAMAASLAALVTAECFATSSEMAALRGSNETFVANREAVMRSLRNHRRAVYGDGNDYEKLSVLPAPLSLKNCPDLALTAEAQHRWDEAVERVRAFGLRTLQATDLSPSPVLSLLMTCAAQGLEPIPRLTVLQPDDSGIYHETLHPAVGEALARLDYPTATIAQATAHITGTHSLRRAPGLNHASLRARGLSEAVLEKIESYIPCVNSVRLAVTPWIIGTEYCRTHLKIPALLLESPTFDLLHHLGFSEADCEVADVYCYGHGTARSAKALHLRHRPLFARGNEITAEARIRMAASVQSFISGDTGIAAPLPAAQSIDKGAEIALSAWRCGLKSLTLVFDPTLVATTRKAAMTNRRIAATTQPQAKPFTTPPRRATNGKSSSLLVKEASASTRAAKH